MYEKLVHSTSFPVKFFASIKIFRKNKMHSAPEVGSQLMKNIKKVGL